MHPALCRAPHASTGTPPCPAFQAHGAVCVQAVARRLRRRPIAEAGMRGAGPEGPGRRRPRECQVCHGGRLGGRRLGARQRAERGGSREPAGAGRAPGALWCSGGPAGVLCAPGRRGPLLGLASLQSQAAKAVQGTASPQTALAGTGSAGCLPLPLPLPLPQPDLIIGCLALLPSCLTRLEIDSRVTGPLPAALQRNTAWRCLALAGDTAGVGWGSPGSAAAAPVVAPLLTRLRLSFTRPRLEHGDHGVDALSVPEPTCRFLGACSALQALDIEARWSPALADLCRSLPVLRQLRWAGARAPACCTQQPGTGWARLLHAAASQPATLLPLCVLPAHAHCA